MGHDGLQQGDRRGDGRKDDQQVEDDAEDRADHAAHAVKHILHGDEEKLRTADLTRGVQRETRGHDAQTRHQSDDGVHDDDDRGILFEVLLLVEVGAVGNHNAHRDAQREKELAHGIEQNLQKAADGQPLKMRGQVVQKALHAGAGLTVRAGVMQRQRVACNDNDQYQQNRHHVTGDTLDAALDTVVDDERRHTHEQQCEYNRRDRRGDKRGKVAVGGSGLGLAGQVDHRILSDPTANDSIVGHNQHRHQKGQNAEEFPLR